MFFIMANADPSIFSQLSSVNWLLVFKDVKSKG